MPKVRPYIPSLRALFVGVCFACAGPGLAHAQSEELEFLIDEYYQKDLPGLPNMCEGGGCDGYDSEQVVDHRMRAADSNYDDQTFGSSGDDPWQEGGSGSTSGGRAGFQGTIRGEFSGRTKGGSAIQPADCDLKRRANPQAACTPQEMLPPSSSSGELGGGSEDGGVGEPEGDETGSEERGGGGGAGAGEVDESGPGGSGEEGAKQSGPEGTPGGEGSPDSSPQDEGDDIKADSPPEEEVSPPEPEEMPELEEPEEEIDPPSFEELIETLLLVLAVIFVVFLLAYIARKVQQRLQTPSHTAREDEVEGAEQLIEELEELTGGRDHNAWANDARYEEAIHALLLDALKLALRTNRDLRSPSLTSREILHGASLDAGEHAALKTLVQSAELCIFARRAATEAMYRSCVAAQAALARSLGARLMKGSEQDTEVPR